ncbi:Ataxin-1 and HBP1 module [Ancylostoma caninum]|uniref:Ataxin-1 and HBP1 module n=1 Tax=Ancylostoma caninum TaxID=29170 RepID=A0A368G1P3_ANCCA|nr:Ataxin-1 and HBP1 module [Ancylostoma caninum]
MNGDGQQQPGPSGTVQWSQPALADILTALQMQLARTAAEGTRVIGQPTAPVLSGASPLVNPLPPQLGAAPLPNPTPLPLAPAPNPLLHSYQQLLNPAFLELQRQLIAQQTAQFRLPLLPAQMTSSISLPSLRQMPSALPHVSSLPNTAAALPARPVPRKPSVPVVVTTPSMSPTTSTRTNGSQFAVPQDPVVRKPSLPQSRPSTSADEKERAAVRPKSPEFEMGKLPVKNYIPSHFMKGTMIQMASGKLKKVEEMSSDDFLLAAPLTREFNVDASVVVEIAKASTLARATLEPQLEHPFFVLGKGWCSCDPHRTAETYGLECQELKVSRPNNNVAYTCGLLL